MILIWQLYSLLSDGDVISSDSLRRYGTNITAWAALSFIANENLLLLDVSDNCSCIGSILRLTWNMTTANQKDVGYLTYRSIARRRQQNKAQVRQTTWVEMLSLYFITAFSVFLAKATRYKWIIVAGTNVYMRRKHICRDRYMTIYNYHTNFI